jgi:hypothetical protein
LTDTEDGDVGVMVDGDEGSGANLRNKPGRVVAGGWLGGGIPLPRLGMMVARAAGPSRSGPFGPRFARR